MSPASKPVDGRAERRTSISYSARRDDLAGGMPIPLRVAPPSRAQFFAARDPLIAKQADAEKLTEAQRREASDATDAVALQWPLWGQDPPMGEQFERVRDPLVARQLDDIGKSEAQRRAAGGKDVTQPKKLREPLAFVTDAEPAMAENPPEVMDVEDVLAHRDACFSELDRERHQEKQEQDQVQTQRLTQHFPTMI